MKPGCKRGEQLIGNIFHDWYSVASITSRSLESFCTHSSVSYKSSAYSTTKQHKVIRIFRCVAMWVQLSHFSVARVAIYSAWTKPPVSDNEPCAPLLSLSSYQPGCNCWSLVWLHKYLSSPWVAFSVEEYNTFCLSVNSTQQDMGQRRWPSSLDMTSQDWCCLCAAS